MRRLVCVQIIAYVITAVTCQKNVDDKCPATENHPCYECASPMDGPCGDKFNYTTAVDIVNCVGSCAKWLQRPKNGVSYVIRTCGSKIKINMIVAEVCMHESRPGSGQLCFCRDKNKPCNSSPSPFHMTSFYLSRDYALPFYWLVTGFVYAISGIRTSTYV